LHFLEKRATFELHIGGTDVPDTQEMIMNAATTVPDTIEREITIAAPLEVVWPLVSEPGWWINEGEIREHSIEAIRDNVWKVSDVKHGDWLIEVVGSVEQESVSFRWLAGESDSVQPDQLRTLVEFTLQPVDGGTLVRVVESGFAVGTIDEKRRNTYDANAEGWEIELAAAKTHLEQ